MSNHKRRSLKGELDVVDVYATAIQIAAEELGSSHPQDEEYYERPSNEIWETYLIQQAVKRLEAMTPEEAVIYRATVLT